MPPLDYETPFGWWGAGAGAGLGAGLGRAVAPFDYPRRAAWNVPVKLAEGDVLGAAPGLLGLGVGGALAARGKGPLAAVLGGTLASGVAQGVGEAVAPEEFEAPSGRDLARALGTDPDSPAGRAMALGAEAALDPLPYAGGLLGARAGARYGRHFGELAAARGPRWPGGPEKLESWLAQGGPAEERARALLAHPEAGRILSEIPPGSEYLGRGEQATAMARGPLVTRIAGGPGTAEVEGPGWVRQSAESLPPAATPVVRPMVRPAREVAGGGASVRSQTCLSTTIFIVAWGPARLSGVCTVPVNSNSSSRFPALP
jgi:hypothetical protein